MSSNKSESKSKIWQLELANKNMELEISARKDIERVLKNREDRFKIIFNHAPVAYFLCDLNGTFVDGNLAAFQLTGFSIEELDGANFIDINLIDKKDQKAISEIIFRSGKGEYTGPDEFFITKKDGSLAIIELSTSPVTIHGDKRILGIAHNITERKLTHVKLQASEKRYRKLFDSAHDALMTLNPPTWKFTSGNPAILEMFKVKSIEEFLTYGPWDISPEKQPDGRLSSEKAKEMIGIAMTKGSNYFEWTHKRINGESFPATVLLTKIQLKDEIFLQATVRDITERKQVDDTLKKSESILKSILNSTGDGLLVVDNSGCVTHRNDEFIKMWNIPPNLNNDIDDSKLINFVLNKLNEPSQFLSKVKELYNSTKTSYDLLYFKDGRIFARNSHPLMEKKNIAGRVWSFRDITVRKQAELELKHSKERFKHLFDSLGDAVYVTELGGANRGRILEINRAAEKQTGYTRDELLRMNIIRDLYVSGSGESKAKNWEEKLGSKEIIRTTEKKKRKDGTEFWTDVIVTPLEFKGEKAGLSINHDITERKQAEKLKSSIYMISEAAHSAKDLEDLFKLIHQAIGKLVDAKNFYIAIYDAESEMLSFPYFVDEYDEIPAPQKLGKGLTEYVLRTGKILLASPKVFEKLVKKGKVESHGARSIDWLGVPLKTKDTTIGILVIQSYTKGVRFNEETKEILSFVSNQVAMAIERKQAEKALRESEERFRKLFDSAKDALMTLNPPTWKFTSGNPAILDMFKVKNIEEFLTYGPWDISPEKQPDGRLSSEKAKEMIGIAMTKGSNYFEWTHKRINGESFPATVLLTKIQLKDKTFLQATVRDNTGRKLADAMLRESEKKYRDLFEKSKDAMLIIKNGKFVDCNQSTINMLGYNNKDEFLNTHPSKLSPEKQPDEQMSFKKAEEMMKIALKFGNHRFEWEHKKADGKVFPVEVLLTAISSDKNNKIIHTVWRDITERKLAEEEVKRLAQFPSENPNPILRLGLNRIIQYANNAACNIFSDWKLKVGEATPKVLQELMHDIEKKRSITKDISYNDKIFSITVTFHKEFEYIDLYAMDLTERKQMEEALKENEEKYHSLTENVPLGIYRNTPGEKGKYLEVNKALVEMLGFKDREAMLATSVASSYVSPDARKIYSDKLKTKGFLKNEEIRLRRQDGSTFIGSSTARAIKDKNGKVVHYDGIIEDVTEQQELRTQLLESEEKFRSIVNNSPDIILRIDLHGVINFINYEYSSQKPEDIIGKTIYELMPIEFHDTARSTIKKVFKTGESFSFENLGISADNSVLWYRNHVAPLKKNDKVVAATIIVTDISEQKQIEIMKNEFVGSVSHELRTPLTIIRESLSLLSEGIFGELNKDQLGIVNPCMADVDRLARIINNLLDISRIEGQRIKLEREMIDIVKLAKGVVSSFGNKAKSKNIELVFTPDQESINMYLDRDRIIQVFMNLIGNSMKFTEKGKIEVFITKKANEVVCCIADTGRGIEQKDLGTLFDRFHQVGKVMRAGEKGSGLGLSISKGIVKLHNGRIWVDSKINKGSKFNFALPIYSTNDIIIENIDNEIQKVTEQHIPLSLLVIRLNNYSDIESKFGIDKANKVTKLILQIIQDTLVPGEFSFIKEKNEVILFSDITKPNIIVLFSKLEDMLKKSVLKIDEKLAVDIYYGYSLYPDDGDNASELLQKANKLLLKNIKA